MKEDVFGPLLRAVLETTTEPLSAPEMREAVEHPETGDPPSIQRVYAWIKSNRQSLVQMGTTTRGGSTYVWRTNPMVAKGGTRQPSVDKQDVDTGGTLEVGKAMRVTRLWVNRTGTFIELTDEDGCVHTVTTV